MKQRQKDHDVTFFKKVETKREEEKEEGIKKKKVEGKHLKRLNQKKEGDQFGLLRHRSLSSELHMHFTRVRKR